MWSRAPDPAVRSRRPVPKEGADGLDASQPACILRRVIRLLVRTVVVLLANAVGLIVAAAVLDGMELDVTGFVIALIIFTVAFALMLPFLASMMRRRENTAALGGVALIATLVSLIITTILTDGLSISGAGTWIAATVIVWVASLIAAFVLPYLGLKKYMEEKRA
jgi:uncharacterized membrane protein YvlD (DUF360 family)